jgi:REP element-mobilizing transposase RayT
LNVERYDCGEAVVNLQRKSLRLQGYDYAQSGAYFVTICTHQQLSLFGQVVDEQMALNTRGRIVQSCWDQIPMHYPMAELDAFVVMPNHVHGVILIVNDRDSVGATHGSPVHTSNSPAQANGSPVHTSNSPAQANGSPVHTSNSPVQANGSPVHTSNSPAQANGSPVHTSNSPVHTNNSPVQIDNMHAHGSLALANGAQRHSLGAIIGQFKSSVTRHINRLPNPPDHPIWHRNYYDHIIRNEADLNRIREYIINNPARWHADRFFA